MLFTCLANTTTTNNNFYNNKRPQGCHSQILMTGGLSDFFGSEILAKSDFFQS